MSEAQVQISPEQGRRITKRMMMQSVAIICVLVAGIFTMRALEAALGAVFDKPEAPLAKELGMLSRRMGTPVKYEAAGQDQVLNEEMIATLGTTKYVVREYENKDKSLAMDAPGRFVNLNVNYYGKGSATPHVPEVCWKGSGMEEAGGGREIFEVPDVKRKDGSSVDLRVRLISFVPTRRSPTDEPWPENAYCNVAYVFQVNGEYVASPNEVTSRFWKASNQYAYHCKIEITPMDATTPADRRAVLICTREEAKRIVSDFIRYALPEVEECLPDPSILSAPAGEKK